MKATISVMISSFILIIISGCTVIFVTDPSEVQIVSRGPEQSKAPKLSKKKKFQLKVLECKNACAHFEKNCSSSGECDASGPGKLLGLCVESCINDLVDIKMARDPEPECVSLVMSMKKHPDSDSFCRSAAHHARDEWGLGCMSQQGQPGVCSPIPECRGSIEPGHCPGTSNITCCIAHPCADQSGICLDADQAECKGEWVDGLCPRKPPVRCCRG